MRKLWSSTEAQSVIEYALLGVAILVIVVGTIRLVGKGTQTMFSSVNSAIVGQ